LRVGKVIAEKAVCHLPTSRGIWEKSEETRGESLEGESGVQEHKSGNIPETRKDRRKVTAYRNSSTLFRTVTSPTPCDLLFLKIVLCTPPKTPINHH